MSVTQVQRRHEDRYGVKEEVFVALRPDFRRLGSVRDISRTGLGFEYCRSADDSCFLGNVEVDLFCQEDNYLLSRIPCKLVYDQPVNGKFGGLLRHCGVQFGVLSNHVTAQLSVLIESHGELLSSLSDA